MSEVIYVAKLGKTVGLDGFLKIHLDTDFPEQFRENSSFLTNKKITLVIEKYNEKNQTVKFKDINSIDDAKKLINQFLYSTIEQTRQNCDLEDREFFWFDLVGCSIVEGSKTLGIIKDLHRYPLTDYFEITTHNALVEKGLSNTFLIKARY